MRVRVRVLFVRACDEVQPAVERKLLAWLVHVDALREHAPDSRHRDEAGVACTGSEGVPSQ